MRPSRPEKVVLRFGAFELDTRIGELRKGGTRIKLPPQPVKVLTLLASRPAELVSREEVRRELWGDDTFVDVGQGLGACISRIRIALSDNARKPRYIETLPRRGYRFIAPVEGLPPPRKLMLAVLPFDNLSGNPREDYFCEGLTEEIITEAACLNSEKLGVIARTSVLKYKDEKKDVREIGAELDADYILEGSVRRQGERARISAQLVQVSDQSHLWAETYQRGVRDVLGLQSEIARKIAEAIDVKLARRRQGPLGRPRHPHSEAYQAYLKGRFFWNKRTERDIKRAIEFFQEAIELEANYALAYSGLADAYHMLGSSYVASSVRPREAFPKARTAALKALEIDDTLAEAHASLAAVLGGYEWDWQGWRRECRRALELNPSYATARQWYAEILAALGCLEEALEEIGRAREVDPLSAAVNATAAWLLYFSRQYEQAIAQCERTIELHPSFPQVHLYLGLAREQIGQWKGAFAEFARASELSSRAPETVAAPGHTYGLLGKRREAETVLGQLRELSRRKYVSSYLPAKIHAALGEKDEAFAALDRAMEERSDWLVFLKVDPCLDPLRQDLRFRKLLRRVRLSERR